MEHLRLTLSRLHAELGHRNGRLLDSVLLLEGVVKVLPAHLHRPLVALLNLSLPVSILRVLIVGCLLERVLRHTSHAIPGHLVHLLLNPIVVMAMIVAKIMILYLLLLVLLGMLLILLMLHLLMLLLLLRLRGLLLLVLLLLLGRWLR